MSYVLKLELLGIREMVQEIYDCQCSILKECPPTCYVRLTVNLRLSDSDRTEFLIEHKVFGWKMFHC